MKTPLGNLSTDEQIARAEAVIQAAKQVRLHKRLMQDHEERYKRIRADLEDGLNHWQQEFKRLVDEQQGALSVRETCAHGIEVRELPPPRSHEK